MPVYKIAELNIAINPVFDENRKRLAPYASSDSQSDFELIFNRDDIMRFYAEKGGFYSPAAAESTLLLSSLCNTVLEKSDGFLFHSSALSLDGEAYLFTAKSGVGKSTHAALWRQCFGSRVTMINDDKPIIRKIDGKFFACGTPWMGKSNIGSNTKAPVKAVFVLKRGNQNSAIRIASGKVFREILEATVIPADKQKMSLLLGLLDEFFSCTQLFLLTCTTDREAARVAYEAANNTPRKEDNL